MAKLNHFDKLQLKEQRFLTIYDFILNIIAMLSRFGSLVLGLIQINAGQLESYLYDEYSFNGLNFI